MQCINCGFENIPGLQVCARCQSSLLLGEIDVTPPRASAIQLGTGLRRFWNAFRNNIPNLADLLPRWRPTVYHPIALRSVVRCAIPGLAQIWHGQKALGRTILIVWLSLLLSAILSLGSGFTQFLFSAACVVHAVTVLLVLGANLNYERLPIRLLTGLAFFFGIWYFIYAPIGWLGTRFYQPLPLDGMARPDVLLNGDVILHEGPWRRPDRFERGEIVVYRVDWQMGGYANFYFAAVEGFNVDRIIGLPGDRVQAIDGKLLVNGEPLSAEHYPLAGLRSVWGNGLDVALGLGEYLVIPSTLRMPGYQPQIPADQLTNFVRVAPVDILGRVALRIRPYSRFGSVK
ncbi:MAG TPA: S26 family signal peptidase [Phycisphaerae bacterium]|nr:S26 family signal peptidase [Phycisphaerae bacterium]